MACSRSLPLDVGDLRLRFVSAFTAILLVQLLNPSDLSAETPNLFAKHFEVVHNIRITSGH
jgi:hypothetical protein